MRPRLRFRAVLIPLAVLTAIEVLLIGKVDAQETATGFGVAALAAAATLAACAAAGLRYRFRLRWLRWLPRIALSVVRDTLLLIRVVARRVAFGEIPADRFEDVPFDPGGADPASAARRALAVAGINAAPNTIALDVHERRGAIRLHRLTPGGAPPASPRWPL